jgi:hypothetical protein
MYNCPRFNVLPLAAPVQTRPAASLPNWAAGRVSACIAMHLIKDQDTREETRHKAYDRDAAGRVCTGSRMFIHQLKKYKS